jgi:hypothetical protein
MTNLNGRSFSVEHKITKFDQPEIFSIFTKVKIKFVLVLAKVHLDAESCLEK